MEETVNVLLLFLFVFLLLFISTPHKSYTLTNLHNNRLYYTNLNKQLLHNPIYWKLKKGCTQFIVYNLLNMY